MAEKENDLTEPLYQLYVDGVHVANLSDPEVQDMFWCSYLLTPISEKANATLRDEATWEMVNFTIKDRLGSIPNPNTFSGGYSSFCRCETDRLTFRSLGPLQ